VLHLHDCERFFAQGIECPFRRKIEHEEDDEEEEERQAQRDAGRFPHEIMFPARRSNEDVGGQLSQFPVIAHGDPEMRERLERMAAFKRLGELPSLPQISPPPFGGRGLPELTSILAAITIMTLLRSMRSTGFGQGFQAVRASEKVAAEGLSRLSRPGRQGSRGGFGGMHMQAPTFRGVLRFRKVSQGENQEMRRLLGFSLGPPGAGFDEFSETGF